MKKLMSMLKLLLDANISPETAKYIRKKGYSVRSILEENSGNITDEDIILIAKKENRLIVTFDYDFAEIRYFKEWGSVGIIYLRTKIQTVEHVNSILGTFLAKGFIGKESLELSLIVLDVKGHRVLRDKSI